MTLDLQHAPTRSHASGGISAYDLLKVGFFLFGLPKNAFGSIDVTKKCNLRCEHCYFFEQDEAYGPSDLEIESWVEKLGAMKRTTPPWQFPFLQCTWVGGEPLVRKRLIDEGRKFFKYNTVVTNGTIPLPNWPDVKWYISIDGDEAAHEKIRNKKGIYARAVRNVRENPQLDITIAYCITKQNIHSIERAVIDWEAAGATHITFDFYTPIETIDADLFVPFEERDRVLEKLIELRGIYRDFIAVPERVLRLMRSDSCKSVTDNCLFATHSFAFGPQGQRKEKCMMGPKADCDRCGCVVPFYLASLTDRRRIVEDMTREVTRALAAAPGRLAALIQ